MLPHLTRRAFCVGTVATATPIPIFAVPSTHAEHALRKFVGTLPEFRRQCAEASRLHEPWSRAQLAAIQAAPPDVRAGDIRVPESPELRAASDARNRTSEAMDAHGEAIVAVRSSHPTNISTRLYIALIVDADAEDMRCIVAMALEDLRDDWPAGSEQAFAEAIASVNFDHFSVDIPWRG